MNQILTYTQNNTEIIVDILQAIFFIIFSYYTNYKISNKKIVIEDRCAFNGILIISITILYIMIKSQLNNAIAITSLIFMVSLVFSKENIGSSILITVISMGINYALLLFALIISYCIDVIFKINNDYFSMIFIMIIHLIMLLSIFRIKKFKHGITFFEKNEYKDILILNISVIILFFIIIFPDSNFELSKNLCVGIITFAILMFISAKKSLQLYYKQKLLEQELNKTKEELANKSREIEDLEAENIEISKKAHTLDHKQKSLARKIDEMMINAEISKEEAAEVRDRLNEIGKELYKEKTTAELGKTEIPEIDDMLKYMQSKCSANKIDFELQLKGNIHHMTNNLITKQDLETLLADHIKNAIIAINHTDNVNRSILVKLGKIDETYGLCIYDSGIEFEKETLENLGKKPSTTHKDEGGTGMGFMNTFDTLRKCNASLIIEEFNKPDKDNYTKAIMIKFDNKNEFKIKSYRENEMVINNTL